MPVDERFFFEHEGLFLLPVEALNEGGIEADFARRLGARGLVGAGWLARFDQAYAEYWRRARELAARASRTWLPPCFRNICVLLEPERVRPYFQPLGRSSWLVDATHFEPEHGSLELAIYHLFNVSRTAFLRHLTQALRQDLSYWLLRSRAEIEDFKAGCRRAALDQAGWRALARAQDWIPRLEHESLRPPRATLVGKRLELAGTGLALPSDLRSELEALEGRWTKAAEQRVARYRDTHARPAGSELDELLEWVRAARPHLLVTGERGAIVWDPERPNELDALRASLAGLTRSAAASLRGDWQVVGERNRSFLDSLVEPEHLPAPGEAIDQDGLTYIHRERRLVAYNVHEPGSQRLREPTPAFERWMLGARTIHEWGHLAVDAGWIPVLPEEEAAFLADQSELARLYEAVVAEAPAAIRALAAPELARLAREHASVGRALLALPLERMSDWQSNLLAQRYLPRVEAETYVRNNSRTLLHELGPAQLFQALSRYAFEYQYLAFSDVEDRYAYFLGSTWFAEQFLARGVLGEARWRELLERVAALCARHRVDESKFRFPAAAGAPLRPPGP